uniref:Integrase catalytic domain-containing protein n=1 Tax=Denticeps clupeoides TaxID=299321 RepID=A0AAY4AHJ9_9TELE
MEKDVREYVTCCKRCILGKAPDPDARAPLVSVVTTAPLELVCIDFWSAEGAHNNSVDVLVVTDHFTKLACAFPCPNQSAKTVARVLWNNFFCIYGFPNPIHSDQGANFESSLIAELLQLAGFSKSHTTPYHTMGNGQAERFNRTLVCIDNSTSSLETPRISSATGHSPFEICHGYQPPIFTHQVPAGGVPSARQMIRSCRKAWKSARSALLIASRRMSTQHDHRHPRRLHFRVGQRVWLSTKDLRLRTESHKLFPRYIGPFRILSRINPLTYRLQLPPAIRVHPVFHVNRTCPLCYPDPRTPSCHPVLPCLVS